MSRLVEGDLVTIIKDLPNKPVMMVHKIKREDPNEASPFSKLIGIECIWFTSSGVELKETFNFKDLMLYEDAL